MRVCNLSKSARTYLLAWNRRSIERYAVQVARRQFSTTQYCHNEQSKTEDIKEIYGKEDEDLPDDIVTVRLIGDDYVAKHPKHTPERNLNFKYHKSMFETQESAEDAIHRLGDDVNNLHTDIDETDLLEGTFNYDDLPPIAHAKLDEHRFKRMYNRVAAWEMPNLRQMATEFVPRNAKQKEVFEFRYTSLMGQEHESEAKVVVQCKASEVAAAFFGEGEDKAKRLHKFKLLCGARYNYTTDIVKMSCDNFPNSIQNKQYLVDTLKRLLKESRDLSKDSFEDIPLDTRHVKRKAKEPQFPKEWAKPQDVLDHLSSL
ncbi:mitochondrial ribosomal subunit protein-domain-containing protein [Lipomyces kononenkoae]|uniref:Mitochondrial ribosomal subunit protein-domain-containing protein n=1 Tax=Lipomyces kononenkoae TaxID=34357 RepID=A0ACC3SV88_LIPKO